MQVLAILQGLPSVVVQVIAGATLFTARAIVTAFVVIVETAATTNNSSVQVSENKEYEVHAFNNFPLSVSTLSGSNSHTAGLCKERLHVHTTIQHTLYF